ncbi:hypothetical protein [Modestobacter sp. KNN46-3]|uniref:hypothetical protein n=1 Tax=Modestobacter sp. KNN46-3 TaxID=2711218 RepID=UPI0013DF29D3|nr:hypothetical protein [Modestobacter sp. KNN46-3]
MNGTVTTGVTGLGWVLGPTIGVVGVLLGTLIGAYLSRQREQLGWQREWLTGRIEERTRFAADVCRAIDTIFVVYGQCADAVAGKRSPVPHERVEAADAAWREVLSTRYVYAHEGLQEVLVAYDQDRALSAEATNTRQPAAIAAALGRLEARRVRVLGEIQQERTWINEALAEHVLPARVRWWRRLRGHPAYPGAPLPSQQHADGDTTV